MSGEEFKASLTIVNDDAFKLSSTETKDDSLKLSSNMTVCENCGTETQVGRTELYRIVCYNCFHDVGGFGYEWKIIDESNLGETNLSVIESCKPSE